MIYNTIQEYIAYSEKAIKFLKENNKKIFLDTEVVFSPKVIGENYKRYMESEGYEVHIHNCEQCKHFDIQVRWK